MARRKRCCSIWFAFWLLLTVAFANLWIRSHLVSDSFGISSQNPSRWYLDITTELDRLRARAYVNRSPQVTRVPGVLFYHHDCLPIDSSRGWQDPVAVRWKGFEYIARPYSIEVRAPFWSMTLFFALLSAWAFYRGRVRQRRRLRAGLCLACGYDLRASTERCPECGTAIPAEVRRAKEVQA
jgi:hypothetical protein